ncbi:MAG: hypothetical protein ABSE16_13835 [Verrucomicrobiota bacterium]|jgi:hypothetical protein
MNRNGKIARLPGVIRDELNRRLQDGEPGKNLVQWLNGLPKVKKLLADQFAGRPIARQNLSNQTGLNQVKPNQTESKWIKPNESKEFWAVSQSGGARLLTSRLRKASARRVRLAETLAPPRLECPARGDRPALSSYGLAGIEHEPRHRMSGRASNIL